MNTFCLSLLVSTLFFVPAAPDGTAWQELKGKHFVIYHTKSKKSSAADDLAQRKKFSGEVLRKAEQYYKRIADKLGYTRHSKFWTWDNRVKIYLYPDHDSYVKFGRQPEWTGGMANYKAKLIISCYWENKEKFLANLLPHELAHMLFRDFIGFKGEVPLWLDEGVAQWQEQSKGETARQDLRKMRKQGNFLQLEALTKINSSKLKSEMNNSDILRFYIQSVSIVNFLIVKHGKNNFTKFCRQLRDGKTMNQALKFTYPTSIRSIKDLQSAWLKHLFKGRN